MSELDSFLLSLGRLENYVPKNLQVIDDNGCVVQSDAPACEQIREELVDFCNIITAQHWYANGGVALELGLGPTGATHFLWSKLFAKVTTVEWCNEFIEDAKSFYLNYTGTGLDNSQIIYSDSCSPKLIADIYNSHPYLDFLFIDSSHEYSFTLTEWLVYAPLVRKGGIIAFHDPIVNWEQYRGTTSGGVPKFISELKEGRFPLHCPHNMQYILHNPSVGIAYYIVN